MDRIGTGPTTRIEHLVDVEIGLGGGLAVQRDRRIRLHNERCADIAVGIDGNGREAHLVGRADDPPRDLAAIGDQQAPYGLNAHVRHFAHSQRSMETIVGATLVVARLDLCGRPPRPLWSPVLGGRSGAGRDKPVPYGALRHACQCSLLPKRQRLHPPCAELLGALDHVVVTGGQREADKVAGVARVDHAVVRHPGRGE